MSQGPEAAPIGPTRILERIWPGYPEWLAMLAEILAGHNLDPDQGWFRKAVSRSRFDWNESINRLDVDHDGVIVRGEFHGRAASFRRLDRDRDGILTQSDFDYSNDRGESADFESFLTADRDGDGKLTRPEFETFARETQADPIYRLVFDSTREELEARLTEGEREHSSFLTLADFQEAFALADRRLNPSLKAVPPPGLSKVDTPALLRSFLRREIGAFGPGPALNDPAPDFTLKTPDGRQEISLSTLVGPKPVVLIFGNLTCGPFREHGGSLERLYDRYKNRANFLVVYTREAHPADGWQLDDNRARGITHDQPRDLIERSKLAQTCRQALRLSMPVLVDSMDDRVASLYSGIPSRAYLIDPQGKIAYKGGRGPFGFRPASLEQSLILLLDAESVGQNDPDPPTDEPTSSTTDRPDQTADAAGIVQHAMIWAGLALVVLVVAIALARTRRPATSSNPPSDS